jgi:hypothetical protein
VAWEIASRSLCQSRYVALITCLGRLSSVMKINSEYQHCGLPCLAVLTRPKSSCERWCTTVLLAKLDPVAQNCWARAVQYGRPLICQPELPVIDAFHVKRCHHHSRVLLMLWGTWWVRSKTSLRCGPLLVSRDTCMPAQAASCFCRLCAQSCFQFGISTASRQHDCSRHNGVFNLQQI